MRFLWTIGPLTIIDFTLFKVTTNDEDVITVHHKYSEDEDDERDGPPDMFGR